MPEISDERLDEMLAAAEKATPGPWTACHDGDCTCGYIFGDGGIVYIAKTLTLLSDEVDPVTTQDGAKANAKYLRLCDPATISTLIAEVKAARAGKGVGETVVVPLTPTAEMLKAGMDDLGWWVEPHNDMSTADAASINAMQMAVIEGLYRAMLAAAPALASPTGNSEDASK